MQQARSPPNFPHASHYCTPSLSAGAGICCCTCCTACHRGPGLRFPLWGLRLGERGLLVFAPSEFGLARSEGRPSSPHGQLVSCESISGRTMSSSLAWLPPCLEKKLPTPTWCPCRCLPSPLHGLGAPSPSRLSMVSCFSVLVFSFFSCFVIFFFSRFLSFASFGSRRSSAVWAVSPPCRCFVSKIDLYTFLPSARSLRTPPGNLPM